MIPYFLNLLNNNNALMVPTPFPKQIKLQIVSGKIL